MLASMFETMTKNLQRTIRDSASRSRSRRRPDYNHRSETAAQDHFMSGGRGPPPQQRAMDHNIPDEGTREDNQPRQHPLAEDQGYNQHYPAQKGKQPLPTQDYRYMQNGEQAPRYGNSNYENYNRATLRNQDYYNGYQHQNARELTPEEARITEDINLCKRMGGTIKFSPETIGFFWPDMSLAEHPKDTVEISGKTNYRNVRDFIDAAERIIQTKTMPVHIVRNNLHLCLKGIGTTWY
ncbi:hypothetical protein K504DRAFT_456137 [Pleomassaria siparia CBS 279.74]|uniref:Uncharacterized protein n=1 Tax=Pleomassaria siparia CBS 279.74 TaxID=1314801 RepID=A0A6G1K5P1_9PLEO|nr:hypothetical protein K504DRAFT_456137 [Pleomassaria siparia CBS 279.74]